MTLLHRSNDTPPKVSVVLPVFNAQDTIRNAVQSVLDQSFSDLELIVVDDGSTDETPSVLAEFKDLRLRIHRKGHRGVAAAANAGTQLCTATIIARMDADDIADRHRLQAQLQLLHGGQADVVGCQVRMQSSHGSLTKGMQRYERWINSETLTPQQISALRFVEFPLVNPTLCGRREYFELEYRNNSFPEDYDLFLRAAATGLRFAKVSEALLTWNDEPQRLTRTDDRYSDTAFMQCRRHHLRNGPLADVRMVDFWGAGMTGKPWLRWLCDQQISVRRLFDVSPRKIGQRIHGSMVLDAQEVTPPDGTPMLVGVGADGARQMIADFLTPLEYVAGRELWFVA